MTFAARLAEFAKSKKMRGKGPLSVALFVTAQAAELGLPLDAEEFLTEKGGQVKGLGMASVQNILARFDITRVLSKEAGRTSRGSIDNMRAYIEFLNAAHLKGDVDLDGALNFWVQQVQDFFAAKPFVLKLDPAQSVGAAIRNLIGQARERQEAMGVTIVGTVLQHLVGAKLALICDQEVGHNHANANDISRTGDFEIGDVTLHVTTAPMEALIAKCAANLEAGRRPLIVTTRDGLQVAEANINYMGLEGRIDVLEFEQFLTSNVYERGSFTSIERKVQFSTIIEKYNELIGEYETDPGLRIEFSRGT